MRLVLLRDSRWPDQPGVCCWRAAAHAAFGAAGAAVTDVTWQGPDYVPPAPKPTAAAAPDRPAVRHRRWEWLPRPVRAGLTDAQKVSRKIRKRVAARRPKPAAPPVPGLTGAAVIVAESLPAALAAVDGGAPGDRLWALALPPTRTLPGGETAFSDLVDELAPRIAGFLTDSELGRDAVERAAASGRPRVIVLPPVVPDRPCPQCGDGAAAADSAVRTASAGSAAGTAPASLEGLDPGTAEAVAQLAAWRHPSDTYSFPMARRRGLSADWAPTAWLDWAQDGRGWPRPSLPDTPSDWSAAAQDRGARDLLAATLPVEPSPARPHRDVLISGFDLKFIRELGRRLDDRTDFTVSFDEWKWVSSHTDRTKELLAKADTIVAEWARPSAGWLAERKQPGQNLIVRLHRFELDSAYPKQIDIDKVDAVVYIAPALGPRIHDEIGWPKEKLVYIPNFLDIDWLDRPKVPDARFSIGMVGTERFLKRLDLALDVVAAVRREDTRFALHVRSMAPWENPNVWANPDEQEYAGWCRDRVERDPLLRGGVIFDPPGRDMARWYRRVGAFLSMSDIEGVHLAAAEAMASGAVPVFRPWPGVRDVYDERWIHPSVDEAAAALLANADPDVWAERSVAAKAEMRRRYDPAAVVTAWADLLHGELDRAREPFASYVRI
jgi:glycosyltransferase involved in cell wall biosynthesis